MGCSGDDMKTEVKRVGQHPRGDQTGNMSHVGHQQGTDFVPYLRKLGIVEAARVTRKTSQNNFWLFLNCDLAHLLIIYLAGLDIFHTVTRKVVQMSHSSNRMAMGQMAALVQPHTKHRITRIKPGKVNGYVC